MKTAAVTSDHHRPAARPSLPAAGETLTSLHPRRLQALQEDLTPNLGPYSHGNAAQILNEAAPSGRLC
jgi:hypothetical protein